jgi:alpha-glucosidase (family GH31 glycosyl hydrolase)
VAPVLEKGAGSRKYYLPKGLWYSLTSSRLVVGGKWFTDSVNLKKFPVFLKEGSFLPHIINARIENTAPRPTDTLGIMYLYSDHPTTYELFTDDGVTKNSIEKNQFERLLFYSSGWNANGLELRISTNQGKYPGKPLTRTMRIELPQLPAWSKLYINGKLQPLRHDDFHNLQFMVRFDGKPVMIRIEP